MKRRHLIKLAAAGTLIPTFPAAEKSAAAATGTFTLPELGYDNSALAPYIDAQTMEIHHGKHHAGYVTKLNAAVAGDEKVRLMSLEDLVKHYATLPEAMQNDVRNNAGGHYNHSLFWTMLSPNAAAFPSHGALHDAIMKDFGSFEKFQTSFGEAATKRFGSGWAWLTWEAGKLETLSTANQDNPLTDGKFPLLGLDVWEHAYYLNYQNKRPEYVQAFWSIVNWKTVEERFTLAQTAS